MLSLEIAPHCSNVSRYFYFSIAILIAVVTFIPFFLLVWHNYYCQLKSIYIVLWNVYITEAKVMKSSCPPYGIILIYSLCCIFKASWYVYDIVKSFKNRSFLKICKCVVFSCAFYSHCQVSRLAQMKV